MIFKDIQTRGFSIRKQILFIFIIITTLLITVAIYNYLSIQNYKRAIEFLKRTSLEQLSSIGKIQLNAGLQEIYLLHHLDETDIKEKFLLEQELHGMLQEIFELYVDLPISIVDPLVRNKFDDAKRARDKYLQKLNEGISLSNREALSIPINYEKQQIRPYFDIYITELDELSDLMIKDAEYETNKSIAKINGFKQISNCLIAIGILTVFFMTFFLIRMYKRISNDYRLLKISQEELKKMNEQLEKRVEARTLELENVNFELQELNKGKDKFIQVISHDLKNPLAAMAGSSEILAKNIYKMDLNDIQQMALVINNSTNKLVKQFDELVDWAKSQQNKIIFLPKKIELYGAVEDSIKLIRELAQKKEIQINNHVSAEIRVKADINMLRSIIQNLITNAIKFTPKYGKITVDAQVKGERVEIKIKDTGVGMTAQIRDNLFRENIFPTSIGTENEAGSGLGLTLVKSFVEKHKGKITIESEEEKGTTITFSLPKEDFF